jgi:hypothetical protein
MRSRKWLVFGAIVAAVVGGIQLAVMASTGSGASALDQQGMLYRDSTVSTTSKTYADVPGLSGLQVCAANNTEVSVTMSVGMTGAAANFQVQLDDTTIIRPGAIKFDPAGGSTGFSFTYVQTVTSTSDDSHTFDLQWRSPTGGTVNLNRGDLNALFQLGMPGGGACGASR